MNDDGGGVAADVPAGEGLTGVGSIGVRFIGVAFSGPGSTGGSVGSAVTEYKRLLQAVCDNRPSGTRGLAAALGTNRSFESPLTNPAYPMPIPAQHLHAIFEVCRFSPVERASFLDAYDRAHPNRREGEEGGARTRIVTLKVADLGDARQNQAVDEMLVEHARQLVRFAATLHRSGVDGGGVDRQGANALGTDARGSDTRGPDTRGPDRQGADANGTDARGADGRGKDARGAGRPGPGGHRTGGSKANGPGSGGHRTGRRGEHGCRS